MTRIAVLGHVRDIERYIEQGWHVELTPWHPVQRAYGRMWCWRYA